MPKCKHPYEASENRIDRAINKEQPYFHYQPDRKREKQKFRRLSIAGLGPRSQND